MDNKKWSKRFSTIFWWTLTILPLFIYVITVIGACFHSLWSDSVSSMANYYSSIPYGDILSNCVAPFSQLISDDLFAGINRALTIIFNNDLSAIGLVLTWMVQVQVIHLLYDVLAWLPRFCHEFMEAKC